MAEPTAPPATPKPVPQAGARRRNAIVAIVAVVVIVIAGTLTAYYLGLFAQPPRPSVLVVGTTEGEETLDPADAYNYMSVNLLQNTMSTLLTYRQAGDGTLEPMLLTEVPTVANGGITADGLTYTLRLRSGATFEDGTAITANTVKYSIDRSVKAKFDPVAEETRLAVPSFLLDPIKGASGYMSTFSAFVADPVGTPQSEVDAAWNTYVAEGVQVVDQNTIRINMGRQWSPMVLLLAFTSLAPVNPNKFPDNAFKPLATDISASGPYRVETFVPDERGEFVRNPRYFGTPAVMERVVIRFYTNAPQLALAMRSGEIDVAYRNLNPEDFNAFEADANYNAEAGTSAVIRYIVFNERDFPEMADKRVRQALAFATNRDQIVQTVFLDSTDPLYSLIPAGMFGHKPVFQNRYALNLAAAQALLTQAGYSTTSKLSFTLWYTPERYGTTEPDVAQLLKNQWEATGMVSVTLNNQEWGTYRQSFRTGQFGVFLLGWFPDYLDPDNYVFPFLHAASGGTASFGSWYANDTLDQLIELQGTQEIASPARSATLGDIQDALADDVPYLPLWQTTQQVVYKKNVTGVILDASQFFRYFTIRVQ